VDNETKRFNFNQIIKSYHTYKPETVLAGRRIDYIIKCNGEFIGGIGFSCGAIAMGCRDKFIGWNKEQREANLTKIISNWRYCLLQKTKFSSKILSEAIKQVKKDYFKIYNEKPVLVEALVEPPYKGTCYLASGFIYLGMTTGTKFVSITKKEFDNKKELKISAVKRSFKDGHSIYLKTIKDGGTKKLVFIKPLHRYWKKTLIKTTQKVYKL